jgi:hypothetical protein
MELGPLSIICGELNQRHKRELSDLVVEVVVDHVLDRISRGWLDRYIAAPVRHCIARGLLTREAMDRAKEQLLRDCNASFVDHVLFYLSVVSDVLRENRS